MREVDWTRTRVLITGATGFIGHHLAANLLARGADVSALLLAPEPESPLFTSGAIGRVNVIPGRLETYDDVRRAVADHEIDTVFHLGAQTIVGAAYRDPHATFETNVRGTYNVLDACRACNTVRRIVVASSDKAYGAAEVLPYTEETPLAGRFPYDASKACGDLIAQSYAASYGLPIAIARCGNVYGPGDLNDSRLVPGTVRALLAGQRPVIRSDGTPERDYLYVDDVVEAYALLAAWLDDPARSSGAAPAFNFGAVASISVRTMVERITDCVGRTDLVADVRGAASAELQRQHLDSSRAAAELGWRATTDLNTGLERTVSWYRSHRPPAIHARTTPVDPSECAP